MRWLRQRLDVAFAVSEDAAAMAGGALGGEYEVLFNGIETEIPPCQCTHSIYWAVPLD